MEMEMPNMRKNSQMQNLRELQQYYSVFLRNSDEVRGF